MPLAFPWERSNRSAFRHPLSNSSHSASIKSVLSSQEKFRSRGNSLSDLHTPGYHANLPDLPQVAQKKEAELNRLIHECFELYHGHRYIGSYNDSDFHKSPEASWTAPSSPLPTLLSSPVEKRSHRQGFLLPNPPERSPSQTVSPYSRLQFTLDNLLPTTPQRPHQESPTLPVLHEHPHSESSPASDSRFGSVSEFSQTFATPQNFTLSSPSKRSTKSSPGSELPTQLSHNTPSPLHKRAGLLKLPFLRTSTSFNLSASLIRSPTLESELKSEKGGLRKLSPHSLLPSPRKLVKQQPDWRASPTPKSKRGISKATGDEPDIRLPTAALPHELSSWPARLSTSVTLPSSDDPEEWEEANDRMPMQLRNKNSRVEKPSLVKKVTTPAAKRTDPYTDKTKLFSRNSRLISRRLHGLFTHPEALAALSEDERDHLAALLGSEPAAIGDGNAPDTFFLKHNTNWRTAIREFQEDLAAGRYEKKWLSEAIEASMNRKSGDYDVWKDENFEQFWGQKASPAPFVRSPIPDALNLAGMVKQNMFSVGDIWTYSRLLNGKGQSESILVEKEVRIGRVDDDGRILFSIPPGQQKAFTHALPPLPRKSLPSPRPTSAAGGTVKTTSAGGIPDTIKMPAREDSETGTLKDTRASVRKEGSDCEDEVVQPAKSHAMEKAVEGLPSPLRSQFRSVSPSNTSEGGLFVLKDAVQALIASPEELEQYILETDGRVTERGHENKNGNAWKLFRCRHENKDIGTLWDLRVRASGAKTKA